MSEKYASNKDNRNNLPGEKESVIDAFENKIASEFSEEMRRLGFETFEVSGSVLARNCSPKSPIFDSLTVIEHETLPTEPTVRLYRGVRADDGKQLAHQVGYLLKKPIFNENTGIKGFELENEAVFSAIEAFAKNPTYRGMMDAIDATGMDSDERRSINQRMQEIRLNMINEPNGTFIDYLISHHIRSDVGAASQDISPFVATSLYLEHAVDVDPMQLMVLDVPISEIAGLGEYRSMRPGSERRGEVLLTGSIKPEWITTVAHMDSKYIGVPKDSEYLDVLVATLGGQEFIAKETLGDTDMHRKSRHNRPEDIKEINIDLIEDKILSIPYIDSDRLRELYKINKIVTCEEALQFTAKYYLDKERKSTDYYNTNTNSNSAPKELNLNLNLIKNLARLNYKAVTGK